MEESQLLQLLTELRSADNETRKGAESRYEGFVQAQPAWMTHALCEVCATSQDTGTVTISLILLRKLFNMDPSPFMQADAATQAAIKGRMLEVLGTAAYGPQRGSAAACVSALAVKIFQSGQEWDELWKSVFQILGAADSSVDLKIVCCEIVTATGTIMLNFFKSQAEALSVGLHNCFQTDDKNAVALKKVAFTAVIRLSRVGLKDQLSPLVPVMLQVIHDRLSASDWDAAAELTEATVEGISDCGEMFVGHTMDLLTGMMQVALSPSIGTRARHMAVEALLTYCEAEPKTVRKVPGFTASFFELLFQYMLNPTYESDWDTKDLIGDDEDLEDDSDLVIGSSGLDRLTNAVGGRKLLKTAQNLFTRNIHSADWKERNAALLLICYCAEGMRPVFIKMLNDLVKTIAHFVSDETKYVRASALDCLTQMCCDLSPKVQNDLHAVIIPPVVAALADPVPHVAACAARCLDGFFDNVIGEDDDDEDGAAGRPFAPYVERVCSDCVRLLETTPHNFVREATLAALSSLTSTCRGLLTPYVHALVPVYNTVLSMPDSPEVMDTKCKAIECVTLLATGVGAEVFAPYAKDVCNYLNALSANGINTEDPRSRFVLRGWTCMVECLNADILPYIQGVVPSLLGMMNMNCDIVLTDAGVGESDEDVGEETPKGVVNYRIFVPGQGEKVAKFHTGLIDDKELASNVVNAMVQALGAALSPYFVEMTRSAISLLSFALNSSIRENGALILNGIMDGYGELHNTVACQQLAADALEPLMEAVEGEEDLDVMETFMDVVSRCVTAFPAIVTAKNAHMVSDRLLQALHTVADLRAACLEKKAADPDEDEMDQLEDEDEGLQDALRSVCEVVGTLLECSNQIFAPLFIEKFLPLLSTWLQPNSDDFSVTRALAVLCDFAQHAPLYAAPSMSVIIGNALSFAQSRKDDGLLQTAFYLQNVIAQYLGNGGTAPNVDPAAFAVSAQQSAAQYFTVPQSRTPEYAACTCNAISLYVSLLQFFGATTLHAQVPSMMATVVERLPVGEDEIEAGRVHDRVLGWMATGSPLLTVSPGLSQALLQRLKAAKPENLSSDAMATLATM